MNQPNGPRYKISMEIDPDSANPNHRKGRSGLDSVYWMVVIRTEDGKLVQTTARRQTYEQAIHVLSASRYAFSAGMTEARSRMYELVMRSTIDDVTPCEDIMLLNVHDFLEANK